MDFLMNVLGISTYLSLAGLIAFLITDNVLFCALGSILSILSIFIGCTLFSGKIEPNIKDRGYIVWSGDYYTLKLDKKMKVKSLLHNNGLDSSNIFDVNGLLLEDRPGKR